MHTIKFSKKIIVLLLTCMLITVAVSACAGGTVTDEEKARAEVITDIILEGIETEDYMLFSQDFSSDMLAAMDEEAFEDLIDLLNNNIGTSEQREMVSAQKTRSQGMSICIFKYQIQYSLAPDIVDFTLYTYETDGQTLVVGLIFDSEAIR